MIKQNNPLLPIFNKICDNKNKRLESPSLKQVIANVRIMQKRGSPTGSSNNPKSNTKDLDLALEQSKRREQDFDKSIFKEMNKLNYLQHPSKTHHEKLKKLSEPQITSNVDPINTPLLPIPETDRSSKFPYFKTFSQPLRSVPRSRVQTCSPGVTSRKSRVTQEFLTRLSTPLTRNRNLPISQRSDVEDETKRMDKLISDCAELNNDMRKINYLKVIEEAESSNEKNKMIEFLTGKKNYKKTASTGDDRFMDEQVSLELKIAKNLNGGRKIWKFNHISFITTVDRMINSVPIVKK